MENKNRKVTPGVHKKNAVAVTAFFYFLGDCPNRLRLVGERNRLINLSLDMDLVIVTNGM